MAQNTGGSAAAWLAALLGLWVLVTPFFWGSGGGGGGFNWLFWSNVVSGIIIAIVAAYAGFARGGSTESTTGSSS